MKSIGSAQKIENSFNNTYKWLVLFMTSFTNNVSQKIKIISNQFIGKYFLGIHVIITILKDSE